MTSPRKRRPRERRTLPERDPYLADLQDGRDLGTKIRQDRDLEQVDIRDPAAAHVSSARAAATVRVSRVMDVITDEWCRRRTLLPCHAEAARRLRDDYEIGRLGATPPRNGRGGGDASDLCTEDMRVAAGVRFERARDSMLAIGADSWMIVHMLCPPPECPIWPRNVAEVAGHYHRAQADVRAALIAALDALAAHFGLSRALSEERVDELAV